MINWRSLLDQHRIPYTVTGSGKDVQLQCPFCGEDDHGQHLGISLVGRGWNCYRSTAHRGRSPVRLLQVLLRCSWEQARELAENSNRTLPVADIDLRARVASLLNGNKAEHKRPEPLALPLNFKSVVNSGLGKPFWDYLKSRDCYDLEIAWLIKHFDLRYALQGIYRYRLIVPIYTATGKIQCWTARTIVPNEPLRYRTPSTKDDEGAQAWVSPANLLLDLPGLWRTKHPDPTLVLCEGPFDAIRVTLLGLKHGVLGTCLFGQNVSLAQAELLEDLSTKFRRIYLLLDTDAALKAQLLLDKLSVLRVKLLRLPPAVKDPGSLLRDVGEELLSKLK